MKSATAFLIFWCLQQPMTFKLPEKAAEQDINTSVKALNDRIAEYGYRDVTAASDGKTIQVSSVTPFNNNVRAKIYKLATVKAEAELRFIYPMSQAEQEQYRPGEAAPKGTKWVKEPRGWFVIREEPCFSLKGAVYCRPKKKDGIYDNQVAGDAHMEFGSSVSQKLMALPREDLAKMRLFVDGQLVDIGGNVVPDTKRFRWVIGNLDGWDLLSISINHPLSLALTH